ncbi:MAG: NBR1-Ig-like domain-containing protein [Chloroflexota bacterium]|nr:NBR1-Ig-like domain-containing protein [Chloroflexota bacterium]
MFISLAKSKKSKRALVLTLILIAVLGAGCKSEPVEPTPNIAGTAAAMAETIVSVQLTKLSEADATAAAAITATSTATPTPAPTLTSTSTPTLEVSVPTLYPTPQVNSDVCLMAHMISETIPDDTVMAAGEAFNKVWVLQNTGTCTWSDEYSVILHHGEALGAPQRVSFPGAVEPGQSFALTIPMVVPAEPGTHLGFWTLESPDGLTFGTDTSALFWIKILVEDVMPPDSEFDIWSPISKGGVKSTDETSSSNIAGDTQNNYAWQGFSTFNLGNISTKATVTGVYMIFEGHNLSGTPFVDLGCMGVYQYNYGNVDPSDFYTDTPGGALWSYCSASEITAGVARLGESAAISAVQSALGGKIQFRYQFNTDTNNDSEDDFVTLSPLLRVEYTLP